MSILLTGATGYIGTSVLPRLLEEGHSVTALVRDESKAATVRAAGADAVVGDATDAALVRELAAASDGVIHLASGSDVDPVFIPAVLKGLGADKPFVHTGGVWTYGSNADITEDSPAAPPAITAWRGATEAVVLGAAGVRGTVVVPSIVYGHGGGLARVIVDAPREPGTGAADALVLIGDGSQHWATVHVDDLAALYVLALERGAAGAVYIGASGANPTVRELGQLAAAAADAGGVAAETVEQTQQRLGAGLAEALLLDQQARGTKARIELGWEPNGPALTDEIATGSYAPEFARS